MPPVIPINESVPSESFRTDFWPNVGADPNRSAKIQHYRESVSPVIFRSDKAPFVSLTRGFRGLRDEKKHGKAAAVVTPRRHSPYTATIQCHFQTHLIPD